MSYIAEVFIAGHGCHKRVLGTCLLSMALALGLLCCPAPALARWGLPVLVSPVGQRAVGVMTNSGLLDLRFGVGSSVRYVRVSHAGDVRRGMPSQFEKQFGLSYQSPGMLTSLSTGDSLGCRYTVGRRNRVYLDIYSRQGARMKTIKVADQSQVNSEFPGDVSCQVRDAGRYAIIEFTMPVATTASHQGARQLYISRLTGNSLISKAVPVLPQGDDQLVTLDAGEQSVAVTRSGWVAVAWPYAKITAENGLRDLIKQTTQWRLRWISPMNTLGAVIPLEPAHGGELCKMESLTCGSTPPGPELAAVGNVNVFAVFGYPILASEEVTVAGHVSDRRAVWSHGVNGLDSIASGGDKVVVSWFVDRPPYTVRAVTWTHGRWSQPGILARRRANVLPSGPESYVNDRGRAAVVWSDNDGVGRPLGQRAVFDF